ncbi:tetratricopeptide repeat protein [Protofrankia coriariae]|uniref:tetratricopeptide repeat protein n=1 Tax=Protofrankia coriariae TaxID=1562887 RepID=UPI002110AD94|nr:MULTISPECIES: tetratricopeptide repeat protein [Protofrankia]
MSQHNLAGAYRLVGRVAEAVGLYEETLAGMLRVLGSDHPNTLGSQNNLANAYQSAGRVEEAIGLYEQTLADALRVLGAEHPFVAKVRGNLAVARSVTNGTKRRGFIRKLLGR